MSYESQTMISAFMELDYDFDLLDYQVEYIAWLNTLPPDDDARNDAAYWEALAESEGYNDDYQ